MKQCLLQRWGKHTPGQPGRGAQCDARDSACQALCPDFGTLFANQLHKEAMHVAPHDRSAFLASGIVRQHRPERIDKVAGLQKYGVSVKRALGTNAG